MAIFQCDLICFTKSFLSRIKYGTGCSSAMRVKFSQTYKKNNFFIWGRLFSSSSLTPILLSILNEKMGDC